MLRAILISPDAELAERLTRALAEIGKVGVARRLDRYPREQELSGVIRAHAPQLFFIDVSELNEALRLAAVIAEQAPGAQVLAFARASEQRTLLELMRAIWERRADRYSELREEMRARRTQHVEMNHVGG